MHIPEPLARRLDRGRAERALLVERSAIDETARTATLSFASEAPYERFWGVEILDCAPASIRQGRLTSGANLLCDHDPKDVIGVVESIQIGSDRVARAVVRFGKSARAEEVWQDVRDGIRRNVSVGYLIHRAQLVETDDGKETYLVTDWEPFEVSLVSVPADATVGIGRGHDQTVKASGSPLSLKKPSLFKESIMENQTNEIRNHAAEIAAIAAMSSFAHARDLSLTAIQNGHTVEQFQQELIRSMSNKPIPTANVGSRDQAMQPNGEKPVVMRSAEDFRNYYGPKSSAQDGMSLADFMRGVAGMKTSSAATRAAMQVGINTSGGYAVPNILMPQILEAMVPASSLMQAGAGIVPLNGPGKNFSFAAVDFLPTAYWRLENGGVNEGLPGFRTVDMTPRDLSFVVPVSRELMQDGVNIEETIRTTIAQAFAKEMDRAGLRGSGIAPEILGLATTPGVHQIDNGVNGAVLNGYGNIFTAVQKVLEEGGQMPNAAIMSPRSLVKLGSLADTTGQPLQVPQMLQPVQLIHSPSVPNNLDVGTSDDCSEIYVGDFTKFIFGMREQLSIEVMSDGFWQYGQIGFVCHARLDVAALYPKAFAVVTGVR